MIYMFLTDGFEEIEALTPLDVLRRCGAKITTVGVKDKCVKGAHDITVQADITLDTANFDDAEMLILPGGPGYEGLKADKVLDALKTADETGLYIAAICAAPSVPGEMGLLSGRRATCFPGFEKYLKGAKICTDKVVCDGNYITAKGAGAASEFAFALASAVCGSEKAAEIKNAMQY